MDGGDAIVASSAACEGDEGDAGGVPDAFFFLAMPVGGGGVLVDGRGAVCAKRDGLFRARGTVNARTVNNG